MTTIVLLAMGTNHVNILTGPARLLTEEGFDVVWVAADCNRPMVDRAEAALGNRAIPYHRFPFSVVNRYRFLPGYRKLRSPGSQRRIARLLSFLGADVVVVGNDTRPVGSDVIRAAGTLGIPTILVQDGVRAAREESRPTIWSRWTSPSHGRPYGTGGATHLAVMSESFAAQLVAAGVDPARIHLTGHPPYDALLNVVVDQQHPRNVLFIDQALQIPVERRVDLLTRLCAVTRAAGLTLVVKLHPRDRAVEEISARLDAIEGIRVVRHGVDIDIWTGTILAITRFSTMAFEAIARGIPVVTLDTPDTPWRLPVTPEVPSVPSVDDLQGFLLPGSERRAMLSELAERQRSVLERETHSTDGHATERVARLIAEIARGGSPSPAQQSIQGS